MVCIGIADGRYASEVERLKAVVAEEAAKDERKDIFAAILEEEIASLRHGEGLDFGVLIDTPNFEEIRDYFLQT